MSQKNTIEQKRLRQTNKPKHKEYPGYHDVVNSNHKSVGAFNNSYTDGFFKMLGLNQKPTITESGIV